jgi:rhomboid protease GluP
MDISLIFLVFTFTISLIAMHSDNVFIKYGFNIIPSLLVEGQIWRLFTYSFIHLNYPHLIGNTVFYVFFYWLGFFDNFTNTQFLVFYFGSTIISAIPFIITYNKIDLDFLHILTGNSGFLFAVIFGYTFLNINRDIDFFNFHIPIYVISLIYLLFTLLINKKDTNICHITGMLWGICYFFVI